MTEQDIAEQAYRNGFSAGYEAGRRSAGERKHGQWLINPDGYYPYCSNCKTEPKHGDMTDYCPKCGAIMDLPKITGKAAAAIDRIGARSHGEE